MYRNRLVTEFWENGLNSFCAILLTDRQTNESHWKHNFLGGRTYKSAIVFIAFSCVALRCVSCGCKNKKNRTYFLLTVVIAYVSILYAGQVGIQALDKLHWNVFGRAWKRVYTRWQWGFHSTEKLGVLAVYRYIIVVYTYVCKFATSTRTDLRGQVSVIYSCP